MAAEPGSLGLALVANMPELTLARIGRTGLDNARKNLAHAGRGQSLAALRGASLGRTDDALVIGAGPSLHRHDVAGALKQRSFKGAVIATDSAMRYCLRNGVVPDLVVTLDPHATRIVRWFGNPHLTQADLAADDYFSRQDMDRAFKDEMRANDEILELLARHGKDIRIALSTSSSDAVVKRAFETGMDVYWWNPMYDDPDAPGSLTADLFELNGLPCVNAGGNVGSACWMMAQAVLGKRHVALTGIDFSYYADTPYSSTQYYREAVDLVGEDNLDSIFVRIYNPHLQQWFYTDPAYHWYRNAFLEMVQETDALTYNCTQGGILFGDRINFIPLDDFLTRTYAGTSARLAE